MEKIKPHPLPMRICRTKEEIRQAIADIAKLKDVAVDTETTGLQWWLDGFKPFYISFCGPDCGWGFAFPEQGTEEFKLLKALFDLFNQRRIYQNAKYDLHVLKTVGIEDMGWVEDTMIMAKLIDENQSAHLDELSKAYLPEGVQKLSDPVEAWFAEHGMADSDKRRYDQLPRELLEQYAIQDTIATWWLWVGFKPIIDAEFKVIYEIELKALRELVEVEHWGYQLDVPYLNKMRDRLQVEMDALLNQFRQMVQTEKGIDIFNRGGQTSLFEGPTKFSMGSPDDLGWVLFDVLGLSKEGMRKTKEGSLSLDGEALEQLNHPIAVVAAAWRKRATLVDTFLTKLPTLTDKAGVLHGTFIQMGARTGRMASADPNMQNIPIGDTRKGFIPRPGYVLVSLDYSQIELRILAHYCQEPAMLAAYREGRDLHKTTAAEIYGKPIDQVTDEERQAAKKINFGIIYGLGAPGLSRQLKWPLDKAKEMLARFNMKFPRVGAFKKEAAKLAENRGWVKTYWGRHRRFLMGNLVKRKIGFGKGSKVELNTGAIIDAPKWYTSVNAVVSGTATGDLIKIALGLVGSRSGILMDTGSHIVSVVHDDIQIEMPTGMENELIPKIQAAMENFPMFRVPIKADVGWSDKSWGDKEKWKP